MRGSSVFLACVLGFVIMVAGWAACATAALPPFDPGSSNPTIPPPAPPIVNPLPVPNPVPPPPPPMHQHPEPSSLILLAIGAGCVALVYCKNGGREV